MSRSTVTSFGDLALPAILLHNLEQLGYAEPTPIQTAAIPAQLSGRDVLGQAQTGTGKTAAFALPLLARLVPEQHAVQALVLTPTRELAGQVCSALEQYAHGMPGARIASLYGGAGFREQQHALRRGASIVVGTPGRVMDHLRRGTLDVSALSCVVLDEADEMLRMGFVDDVEWILQQTPADRQVVLFSATMPSSIRAIARRHLKNPEEIAIAAPTATASSVRQRYWPVAGYSKSDALLRILEVEPVDGAIVFVRTKIASQELSELLVKRGIQASALNGDLPQAQREQTVERFKRGQLNVLVATDVAARGLDVDRISHVFNFDIPFDLEAYVHRIGRTGRAGRTGDAILFVSARERRMLSAIERHTRQPIERMQLPDAEAVNNARIERFKGQLATLLNTAANTAQFEDIIRALQTETGADPIQIAAVAAYLANGGPLRMEHDRPMEAARERPARQRREERDRSRRNDRHRGANDVEMERFRVAVGHAHGVRPGNIVGAIANEAGLTSRLIGRIDIRDDHSMIDLPASLSQKARQLLQHVSVCGRPLQLRPAARSSAGT